MSGAGQCPRCGGFDSRVIDCRQIDTGKRRRRECTKCLTRWTTVEVPMEQWQTMKKLEKLMARQNSP